MVLGTNSQSHLEYNNLNITILEKQKGKNVHNSKLNKNKQKLSHSLSWMCLPEITFIFNSFSKANMSWQKSNASFYQHNEGMFVIKVAKLQKVHIECFSINAVTLTDNLFIVCFLNLKPCDL